MLKYSYFYTHRFDTNTVLGLKVCAVWFAGLSLGFFAVRFYGDTLVLFLSQAAVSEPGLLDSLSVTVLPLLLSACAVFLFHSLGVYLVCWSRSFLLGLLLGALQLCYGGASVLMAALLLFSSLLYSPVLIWYWWRRLCSGLDGIRMDSAVCLGAALILGVVDFGFISPFLANVFTF